MKKIIGAATLTIMAGIPVAALAQTHYGVTQGWCAQNGGHFRATGRVGTDIGECTILPQAGGGGGSGGGGSAPGLSGGQRAVAMFGLAAGIIGLLGQAIDQSNQIGDREYRDRQAYDIEQGLASQKQALERALAAAQHAEAHQRAAAMEALAARMKLAEREVDRSLAVIRAKVAANARQSAEVRRPNPFARPSTAGTTPERRSGISGPSDNRGAAPGSGGACSALAGCPDASNRDDRRPRHGSTAQGQGAHGGAARPAEPAGRGAVNPPMQPRGQVQGPAQNPPPTGGMASVAADVLAAANTPSADSARRMPPSAGGPRFKIVDTCGPDPVPIDVVACWHSPFKVRVAAGAPGVAAKPKISRKELLRRLIRAKRDAQASANVSGQTPPVEVEIEAEVEPAGNEEAKLYGYWDHTMTESACRSMNGSWRVPPVRTLPSCQMLSETPRADSGEEFGLAGSETDFSVRETVREFREATEMPPTRDERTLFERANDANRRALEDGRVRVRD